MLYYLDKDPLIYLLFDNDEEPVNIIRGSISGAKFRPISSQQTFHFHDIRILCQIVPISDLLRFFK